MRRATRKTMTLFATPRMPTPEPANSRRDLSKSVTQCKTVTVRSRKNGSRARPYCPEPKSSAVVEVRWRGLCGTWRETNEMVSNGGTTVTGMAPDQNKQNNRFGGMTSKNNAAMQSTMRKDAAGRACRERGGARGRVACLAVTPNSWPLCTRSVRAWGHRGIGTGSPGWGQSAVTRRGRAQMARPATSHGSRGVEHRSDT